MENFLIIFAVTLITTVFIFILIKYGNKQVTMYGDVIKLGTGKDDHAIKLGPEIYFAVIGTLLVLYLILGFTNDFGSISGFIALVTYVCVLLAFLYRYKKRKFLWSDKTIVPDKKIPEDLEIYDIGVLIDGQFGKEDVLATLSELRLRPRQDKILDKFIEYKDKSLKEIHEHLDDRKVKWSERTKRFEKITNPVYNHIIKKGLFIYNPYTWFLTFLTASFISIGILDFFDELENSEILTLINETFWGFGISFLIISFSVFFFHENLEKVIPIKVKLEGLKMYLKTADYYRIKHDEKRFEEIIPYMISLGINVKYIDDMIEYVDKKSGI